MVTPEANSEDDARHVMEQMLDFTETANNSSVHVADIIHTGDQELPTMAVASIDEAAHLWVWNTQTGDRSKINTNMLALQLSKKHEDGSRAFTTIDPGIPQHPGTFKCLLHPTSEVREVNMMTCNKSNLKNELELESHMRHRHKTEWAQLSYKKQATQEAEDRTVNRQMLEALVQVVQNSAPKTEASEEVSKREYKRKKPAKDYSVACEHCDFQATGGSMMVASNKVKKHAKEMH